ncbi:MAG: phenylalanine--tRNA ligase beta subunit-related protein [Thermomicrobiales bacterium]
MKPSKYRSSIEAMLRSAQSGRLRPINPLVDLYNAISLRHLLPVGGEDLAAIVGDVRLTRAQGDEEFTPLGSKDRRHRRPAPSSTAMTIL